MNMQIDRATPSAGKSMARRVAGWLQRHGAALRTVQLGVAVACTTAFIVISSAFAAIPNMTWHERWQLVLVVVASEFIAVALQLSVLRFMVLSQQAPLALRVLRYSAMVLLGTIANCLPLFLDAAPVRLGVVESAATLFWWSLFQSLLVATFLVYQHAGLARSEEASHRLRELQREQRAARRRLVEVQLQALQARVDPQMFFDVLDNVQRLYAADTRRAEALLDEMIVFLRAALPRLRTASSTLAQEVELAASYFRLRSLRGDTQVGVRINLPEALALRAFPAGVILPLLADARTAAIDVHADPGAGGDDMSVSLHVERPPATQALQQVRATLSALYGSAATLECRETAAGASVETRITIAHAAY
jgi:hypothetical protein